MPSKTQRKKVTIVNESKECFSENDLVCCDDYDYEDNENKDEDGCGSEEGDDDADGQHGGHLGADRERVKNGSAVYCDGRRQRNIRRSGNCRTSVQGGSGGGRRQPKTATSDNDTRRRRAAARQDKTAMTKSNTAAAAVQRELVAYLAANVSLSDAVSGINGNGNGGCDDGRNQLGHRSDVLSGDHDTE